MEIINYPNYLIYDDGRVFSKLSNRFLKPSLNNTGYLQQEITNSDGRKTFCIHKLISEHYIPNIHNKQFTDHINGIKSDNRIENLRWVSREENNRNCSIRKDNKTGFKGVCFNKATNKYVTQIWENQIRKHLGYYDTAEEASAVYEAKAKELFGEFYREIV